VGLVLACVLMPTQIVYLASYMIVIMYPTQKLALGYTVILLFAGLLEILQLIFGMITMMSLARAAGDQNLALQCTRAAAVAMFRFAALIFLIIGISVMVVETNWIASDAGRAIVKWAWMGFNGMVCLMLLQPMRRTQDVMEICESPLTLDDR
jgi:hypothetical protein